jgi:hypothetical protein
METISNFINSHAALVLWGSITVLLVVLAFVIFEAIKNTKRINKFRKGLQSGDDVQYVSEYRATGKILDLEGDIATLIIKVPKDSLYDTRL